MIHPLVALFTKFINLVNSV